MPIELQPTKEIKVTPAMAAKWLEEYHFHGQRQIRMWHVDYLAKQMELGHYRPHSIMSLAYCAENDETYLVDGQHSLSALCKTKKGIVFRIDEYYCDTKREVQDLYSQFDRNLKRSVPDILSSYNVDDKLGINIHRTKGLLSATAFASIGLGPYGWISYRASRPPIWYQPYKELLTDMSFGIDLLQSWTREIRQLDESIREGQYDIAKKLWVISVISPAVIIYRHAPTLADEFFRGIAMDDGLRQRDPRKAFLNFIPKAAPLRQTKYQSAIHFMAYGLVRCWNAFVKGEELTKVYAPVTMLHKPPNIAHTPHTNKAYQFYFTPNGEILEQPERVVVPE